MQYEDIWIASESKAKSITKYRVYDYISTIDVLSDNLIFTDRNFAISFIDITNIRLGRQRIAYWSYVQASLLVFISIWGKGNGLAYSILLLLACIALGLTIGWGLQYWVVITYRQGVELKELYLADGRVRGYKGIFGGTKSLFCQLKHRIDTWKELEVSNSPIPKD